MMMNTPVYDFLKQYALDKKIRMHMPGHKGNGLLGPEPLDITEVDGADVLYHENGILLKSQENAKKLFGTAKTLYSTEGSTLAIRAMLFLALQHAKSIKRSPIIAATRNAHKSFLTTCALLDLEPLWLYSEESKSLLSCVISPRDVDCFFQKQQELPTALYLTSPDYLGNVADICGISEVCKKWGVLLLVDNAHGAYLNFLPENHHPIFCGADLCCDSAHKTLPVLTGGAYLHISQNAPDLILSSAENAMATFASTSPSYLILASLDLANHTLSNGYKEKLLQRCEAVFALKKSLQRLGFGLLGNEPMKISLTTKPYGYLGYEIADCLRTNGIEVEFSDPDCVVLMPSVNTESHELESVYNVLSRQAQRDPILIFPPSVLPSERALSPREALFSPRETTSVAKANGRILASPSCACPPAIPISVCGEIINENTIKLFQYYGINEISVVK